MRNKKGDYTFETLVGIVIAMVVLLVLLKIYGVLKGTMGSLPG